MRRYKIRKKTSASQCYTVYQKLSIPLCSFRGPSFTLQKRFTKEFIELNKTPKCYCICRWHFLTHVVWQRRILNRQRSGSQACTLTTTLLPFNYDITFPPKECGLASSLHSSKFNSIIQVGAIIIWSLADFVGLPTYKEWNCIILIKGTF